MSLSIDFNAPDFVAPPLPTIEDRDEPTLEDLLEELEAIKTDPDFFIVHAQAW